MFYVGILFRNFFISRLIVFFFFLLIVKVLKRSSPSCIEKDYSTAIKGKDWRQTKGIQS